MKITHVHDKQYLKGNKCECGLIPQQPKPQDKCICKCHELKLWHTNSQEPCCSKADIVQVTSSPKPSGTKSLKEIHKIVDEIREEIENPKPTKIEKIDLLPKVSEMVEQAERLGHSTQGVVNGHFHNKIDKLIEAVNKLLSH